MAVVNPMAPQRSESATPARRPRGKRDPEGTREAILEAAPEILAQGKRQQMAKRFTRQVLRLSLHGTLRPGKYPRLDTRVSNDRRNST